MKRKIFTLLLALSICISLGTTSFAANETTTPESSDVTITRRMTRTVTKKVSSSVGILMDVTYTYLDSTGDITGVQGISVTYVPDGYIYVSCRVVTVLDDCIVLDLVYKAAEPSGMRYKAETVYVYA